MQLEKVNNQTLQVWRQQWTQQLSALKVASDTPLLELYKNNVTPAIAAVNEPGSDKNGVAIFTSIIKSLLDFFQTEWTIPQITDCACVCHDEYGFLTFAEMLMFTRKAKVLAFGKVFGKITSVVIMEWFDAFSAHCLAQRELYNASLKPEFTEPENPVPEHLVKDAIKHAEQMLKETKERDRYHVNPEIAARIDMVEKIKKAYKKNPDAVATKIKQIFIDEGGFNASTYDILIRALPIPFVSKHYQNLEK